MHIKNLTHTASSKQHRLYVAVPLFTLCAALSFGSMAFQGDVLSGAAGQRTVVEGGGSFSHSGSAVRMDSGDALVAARGIARVYAGAFDIRGWNGAYGLSIHGDALDVAALTTPVIVRTQRDFWIVPAGMQMRVEDASPAFADDPAGWVAFRRPVALPAHFLLEWLPAAERLLEQASFAGATRPAFRAPLLSGNFLQLPVSRERIEERQAEDVLRELHAALLQGDAEGVRAALLHERSNDALLGDDAAALLPELLALARQTGQMPLLLPFFQRESDHLLLALLHPSLRGHAWMLPWPETGTDTRIAALLSLPAADHGEEAVADLAVRRWGGHWNDLLLQTDLPMLLGDSVLPSLQSEILSLEKRGYPERARRYAAAVVGAFYPRMDELSPETSAILEHLGAFALGDGIVTSAVSVPAVQEQAATSSVSADVVPDRQQAAALEEAVRALLTDVGAMFTAKTSIRAVTTGRVAVEGVVIGTRNGDQAIGFTYDVAADQVVNIEKDGSILPYSLPLQKYLEWVREGN